MKKKKTSRPPAQAREKALGTNSANLWPLRGTDFSLLSPLYMYPEIFLIWKMDRKGKWGGLMAGLTI